jgi:hypothetical protein
VSSKLLEARSDIVKQDRVMQKGRQHSFGRRIASSAVGAVEFFNRSRTDGGSEEDVRSLGK